MPAVRDSSGHRKVPWHDSPGIPQGRGDGWRTSRADSSGSRPRPSTRSWSGSRGRAPRESRARRGDPALGGAGSRSRDRPAPRALPPHRHPLAAPVRAIGHHRIAGSPRSGRPARISSDALRHISMVVSARPRDLGIPGTRWSLARLRQYLVQAGVVPALSLESLRVAMKRAGLAFTSSRAGQIQKGVTTMIPARLRVPRSELARGGDRAARPARRRRQGPLGRPEPHPAHEAAPGQPAAPRSTSAASPASTTSARRTASCASAR